MLLKNVNLTYLVVWLNENKQKKTNTQFTVSDVQGYVDRGCLPKYLGGNTIKKVNEFSKSYNLLK